MLGVLAVVAAVGAPALLFRALCVGRACENPERASAEVPFCSLPAGIRTKIASGFQEDRSAEVLAVAGRTPVASDPRVASPPLSWPSHVPGATRVPLVFAGQGVPGPASVAAGTTLDDVAPTLERIMGIGRPHPRVRTGEPIGAALADERSRLALVVVWKGLGSRDLEGAPRAWPNLGDLLDRGVGTLDADTGALPADPAAALATVGTGGLPRDHGITGTLVRNDQGELVRAWGRRAPFSVIAALGDDLDELLGQRPRIGLVGTDVSDRGAIGGNWYLENDRDDVLIRRGSAARQARAAADLLASGYGADEVPDLLVVTMRDSIRRMDATLPGLLGTAQRVSGRSATLVVTSTGSAVLPPSDETTGAARIRREVERRVQAKGIVEAVAMGGVFLDQDALTRTEVSRNDVVAALRRIRGPGGRPLLADAFPALAVSFARYC